MENENKLANYRAKKNREAKINQLKEKIQKIFKWKKVDPKVSPEQVEPLVREKIIEQPILAEKPRINDEKVEMHTVKRSNILKYSFLVTGFLFWGFLYFIFIQLQFGIIYLIVSALFGIYFNTRTGPKDENEISAYSVFNKNCKSIDGTLKAEQFEREIRFGAQSVH